jgi:hypothetical protein
MQPHRWQTKMGDTLMRCLIVFYVVLAAVFAYEGNWLKTWYWVSVSSLSVSVLMMK